MNELIKVTTNLKGEQLVHGRDLHEFLEVKTRYNDWFVDMIQYGFTENVDFISFTEKRVKPKGGRPTVDHALSLDMAKEISMIQRTEKGKQARQYFIEVEKEHKQIKIPTDPMEVLALTFEAQKQANEKLEKVDNRVTELEENAPLSPGDYGYISRLVNQRVATIIAERHLKLTQKQRSQLYKDLNAEIKKVTRVPSRTQLRQRHYDEVLQFIMTWQPSSATIAIVNQLSLEDLTDIA